MATPKGMMSARLGGKPTISLRWATDKLHRRTMYSRMVWRLKQVASMRSRSKSSMRPSMRALAEDEFGAAAADVQDEQALAGMFGIAHHAAENPLCLLFARDDLDAPPGAPMDGAEQILGVARVARRAGRDDADGGNVFVRGQAHVARHRRGRLRDGLELQAARFVKTPAQPRLVAPFEDGFDDLASDFRHQQLHRVGA